MKFNSTRLFLLFLSFTLLYIIFKMINYLNANSYIVECFTNNSNIENSNTSHTVDLPLNTTYSCNNFCGPSARCALTGQQCSTDIDCPGCQPYTPPLSSSKRCILGNNDAGKLTVGVTPTYSPLTSGYGTRERIVTKNLYSQPSQANFGYDNWCSSFNEGQKLFNQRYKPKQSQFMPNYPQMYSLTGEFIGDGPLPSNY
jgi:hypothetical protein